MRLAFRRSKECDVEGWTGALLLLLDDVEVVAGRCQLPLLGFEIRIDVSKRFVARIVRPGSNDANVDLRNPIRVRDMPA